jgi:hypothetical protein
MMYDEQPPNAKTKPDSAGKRQDGHLCYLFVFSAFGLLPHCTMALNEETSTGK